MPIEIRVQRAGDGRSVVTGLRVEADGEVTSRLLRVIRLPEILSALFDHAAVADPSDLPRTFRDAVRRGVALSVLDHAPVIADPLDTSYRAFARTYLAELQRQPHRAMTAAARAHNISRATANRWADACRRLGYLPHE